MSGGLRSKIRLAGLLSCALLAVMTLREPRFAAGQQLGEGMDRTGTVGIQNETERLLFGALICTCGCPREALSTCTCGFAHERRAELRGQLAEGRSIEEIKAAYAGRFGTQALAVPPNVGVNRLLWAVPLLAIVAGAALVVTTLRRWRKRGSASTEADAARQAAAETAPARDGGDDDSNAKTRKGQRKATAKPKRDAYDDKLDDELKALDE
jgi:cytochrome c-type biogenesis protein CcmH